MKSSTVVVRVDGLMSAPVDRDLVILNAARDDYVALDQVGRRIWDLLESPRPVADLCSRLGEEFAGEGEQIAADVASFLDELLSEGLIRVVAGQPA